jgi:excisionase family DNA binding protein
MTESGKNQHPVLGYQKLNAGNAAAADRWLTIQVAAERLSCTERHIYDLIVAGALEATKIGSRAVRVSELSLLAFVEKNKINPEDFFDPDKEKKPAAQQQTTVAKSRWMRPR